MPLLRLCYADQVLLLPLEVYYCVTMVSFRISSRGVTLRRTRSKRAPVQASTVALLVFLACVAVAYFTLIVRLFGNPTQQQQQQIQQPSAVEEKKVAKDPKDDLRKLNKEELDKDNKAELEIITKLKSTKSTYEEWKDLAVELAGMTPTNVLQVLKSADPFGVRTFEKKLLELESERQAILTLDDIKTLFPCPKTERITLPDQRDHDKARRYRNKLDEHHPEDPKDFIFLFFQHLRKAGGTNFCGLAQHNLKKKQVPSYYCMPDMKWSGRRCAGCFLTYTNKDIETNMTAAGHRILGNEWDPFDKRFFDLPAIFATSFRRPLDRALSQFRFECIEGRGCKFKEVEPWWKKRRDLTNVYTWTFSRQPIRRISVGNKPSDISQRKDAVATALDVVIKYNLVLVMEWLAYAPAHVTDVLGFSDTSTMTERIRPHIKQAQRNDGQEENKLGAAGIAKASWTPENYLTPEQYKIMSEDLALDEILTDAARRIFLERAVCDDMTESNWK